MVWECRATATAGNINGGGFKPGATGTDFSQQNAAQYALSSLTSAGAGAIVLTATAAADMVGNVAHITSGTNFTTGWYEVISVSVGVSFTTDRNCTTGVGAAGVANIGGAMSMASTLDQDFLAIVTGGNTVWVKSGSYTLGEAVAVASGLASQGATISFKGYTTARGDNPVIAANMPAIDTNGNTFNTDAFWQHSYLNVTGNTANILAGGINQEYNFCKVTNTSTTAGRACINVGADSTIFGCEIVSQNGTCIVTALGLKILNNYMHDSANGVVTGAATGRCTVSGNIFERMLTTGVNVAITTTGFNVERNTFYGSEAKAVGTGLLCGGSAPSVKFTNNIFYGWLTGVNMGGTNPSDTGFYNTFSNNGTNATNYTLHGTDVTTNPTFTGASQITGTTATTSGAVLTQAGGDFSTVTDNIDYLRVTAGTGVTTGCSLITSHTGTSVTVNSTLGTSSGGDVAYSIGVGHNFLNVKVAGFPGLFPGSETTGQTGIGGVQGGTGSSGVSGF